MKEESILISIATDNSGIDIKIDTPCLFENLCLYASSFSNYGGSGVDDSDSSDWEDECEESVEQTSIKCLFCENSFGSCDETFQHCENHGFDIKQLKTALRLDCFSYIRLINYLREKKLPNMPDLKDNKDIELALSDDAYMKPVDAEDGLLTYDIEDIEGTETSACNVNTGQSSLVFKEDYDTLVKRLIENEAKLKDCQEHLAVTDNNLKKMRNIMIECLEDGKLNSSKSLPDDDGYFQSYAHFAIHQEMLQDEVRTISYRDAIIGNKDLFKDKIVLDVGCGTGILSMFAAQAGASVVFGVDESEIAYQAMDIIDENEMKKHVTIIKGRMEEVDLPQCPANIIISEWMGYFLLFESMLETVIAARDKYLAPGGYLLPNRCDLRVAGISDLAQHQKMISFWDNVYGFKMRCMKNDVVKEASVTKVESGKLITDAYRIHELDLMTCTSADLDFLKPFQLVMQGDGPLTAIVAWFDTYFDLPNKVSFSTSPHDPVTHWKQTVFYLRQPLPFSNGPRLLRVELTIGEYQQEYILQ
ncbi:putative protein art3 [Chamberlinius hualienensis]